MPLLILISLLAPASPAVEALILYPPMITLNVVEAVDLAKASKNKTHVLGGPLD